MCTPISSFVPETGSCAHWKCSQSKTASSKPAAAHQVALETVLIELHQQNVLFNKLPELVDDFKSIKNEIMKLKLACEFISTKLDQF